MYKICRYIATLAAVLLCLSAGAQQRTEAGLFSSPKGFGAAVHFHDGSRDGFTSLFLYSDITGLADELVHSPGVKLSFDYNHIYSRFGTDDRFSLYIGAGASAGYLKDRTYEPHGFMLGLGGIGGMTVQFDRGVSIDISLSIEAGLHLKHSNINNSSRLSLYRNGIFQCWYPQLSILKSF